MLQTHTPKDASTPIYRTGGDLGLIGLIVPPNLDKTTGSNRRQIHGYGVGHGQTVSLCSKVFLLLSPRIHPGF
jgi:hypothetical protein